ncbi:MAG: hypothetical protein GF320_04835 [Armatimonadia bacterium]|nr:hypothetical protein [Armatimonadia bacterium]
MTRLARYSVLLALAGLLATFGAGCAGTATGNQFQVSPATLAFGAEQTTGTLDIVFFDVAQDQTWSITSQPSWTQPTPVSGSGSTVVTVTVDRTGLPPGLYNGTIQIQGNVDLVSINVSMEVPSVADGAGR